MVTNERLRELKALLCVTWPDAADALAELLAARETLAKLRECGRMLEKARSDMHCEDFSEATVRAMEWAEDVAVSELIELLRSPAAESARAGKDGGK